MLCFGETTMTVNIQNIILYSMTYFLIEYELDENVPGKTQLKQLMFGYLEKKKENYAFRGVSMYTGRVKQLLPEEAWG